MKYCCFVISLYEILHKTLIVSQQMWYAMRRLRTTQVTTHAHDFAIQSFKKVAWKSEY